MGKVNKRKIKCKICEKVINAWTERTHSPSYKSERAPNRCTQISLSNDGVLFAMNQFGVGVWFCNECWEEILEYIKKKKN